MTDAKHTTPTPKRRRARRVVVSVDGVEISGTPRAVEDFLDNMEADRRLAEAGSERIPIDDLWAKHGL